jgi:stearoyl-CoA desaturase (Delta-9 desaturase)
VTRTLEAAPAASSSDGPRPAVRPMSRREIRIQRTAVLIVTGIPTLGVLLAVALLWRSGSIAPSDVAAFAVMTLVSGFGITIGFHRMLTHQSFQAHGWLRGAFMVAGSLALEGPPIEWVADHRRHHALSDQPGDPHSPHLSSRGGLAAAIEGLGHAHVGWLFKRQRSVARRWAPDLLKDPLTRRIDRLFPLWAVLTFVLPMLIGGLVGGSWSSAVTGLVYGGLVRIFFVHHVTWSINSICHYFGSRTYRTSDRSTNNWLLSVISLGESWHNNHHAFPSSAIHGLDRGQVDVSGVLIRLLERVGLVWDVRRPSGDALERRRLAQ